MAVLVSQPGFAKPGEHIKAGNALLKPSLSLGMEYRTNVLQSPTDPKGGPNLFVQPGFDVESKTPDTHFTLTSLYTLRKYFQSEPRSHGYSKSAIRQQSVRTVKGQRATGSRSNT